MLSKQSITRIAELQIKIATIDERLQYLKDAMQQLLFENCKVQISFTMINLDIQQRNEATRQQHTMGGIASIALVHADTIAAFLGIPEELTTRKKQSLQEDKTNFLADFTDGNAILILNVFYQQEKSLQEKYQQELQQLLSECMPQPLHDNPILQLHQNNDQ